MTIRAVIQDCFKVSAEAQKLSAMTYKCKDLERPKFKLYERNISLFYKSYSQKRQSMCFSKSQ